ncbi:metallophosphoesterase [Congregibacter sp.]|uniref:metallophosphoesterase n=1 Tax=Congregibacter sp. TaxID=2744308 RepID=UPI00385FC23D
MMAPKENGLARCLFLWLFVFAAPWGSASESDWQGVERVVAVADVHGDYENYIEVLRQAELIDHRGRWSGGTTHFVQLGDVPDRGPDSAKIIEHLKALVKQAKRAGGKVHPLIGNHEAMNMTDDLRYVHPGEYEALKSRRAKRLQEDYLERVVDYVVSQQGEEAVDDAFREQLLKDYPLGFVEHRQYWSSQGEFGEWVAGHNAVIRINRSLFVHGGISSDFLEQTLDSINDNVRSELSSVDPSNLSFVDDQRGPLWYRGLSMGEQTPLIAEEVDALLKHFDVDRIVVGHTPGFGTVVPRYNAKVLAADSGIAAHYGGHLASVLIENGEVFTIQRGQRVPIPSSDEGLLEYFRAINEIEPGVKNLEFLIRQLEEGDESP